MGLHPADEYSEPPLERKPCYHAFKTYLATRGFTVYPVEFDCGGWSMHPHVDIAARMGEYFWAFEYKSANDSTSRGVEQLRSYSEWFDYVVLTGERVLDHRRSENYWALKDLGAGVWNYWPSARKCIERVCPSLQRPDPYNRRAVDRRFRALTRPNRSVRFSTALERDVRLGLQRRLPDSPS